MPKFKRYANGSGTVSKLSGNRRKPYVAFTPAKFVEGKYVREVLGYFETETKARNALNRYVECPPAIDQNITMDGLFKQWKVQGYKNISQSTQNGYNAAWAKYEPIFKRKVTETRTPQFQYCVDLQEQAGVSRSALHQMKVIAGLIETFAVQMDLITRNYAEFIILPKEEQTEKSIFTDFNLKKITESAKNGSDIAKHILIMCYTGWRIQEYLNLTVFDYDRSEHTLKGGLKTEAGRDRIVPVPARVIPYVDAFFDRHEKLCPMTIRKFREEFYALLNELDIKGKNGKITPHSTRHTYNSMLAKSGAAIETRMKLMGHSSEDVNRKVYTHTEIETLQKAVKNL